MQDDNDKLQSAREDLTRAQRWCLPPEEIDWELYDRPKEAEQPAKTMSVRNMGQMLGLRKTDSYWLVHKNFFKTVKIAGTMRIDIESFEDWYSRQVKYTKVNGDPPGDQLREETFDAKDIAQLLGISEPYAYELMRMNDVKYILVDYWKRWPKENFYLWYESQSRYRIQEDKDRDAEITSGSISMPEMAWALGVSRSTVYSILSDDRRENPLEVIIVAERKRITKDSFLRWLNGQTRYQMIFKTIEEAQADKQRARDEYLEFLKEPRRKGKHFTSKPNADPELIEAAIANEEIHPVRLAKESANPDYYSMQEAVEILKVTRQTLSRKIKEGSIPAIAIARSYRIPKLELDRILLEQEENDKQNEKSKRKNKK